jgi:hypothetical protein
LAPTMSSKTTTRSTKTPTKRTWRNSARLD